MAVAFEDILNQAVAMLQRQGRLTYETLQLQFHLDDTHLKVQKNQLLYAHSQTLSDDSRSLAWTGDSPEPAQIRILRQTQRLGFRGDHRESVPHPIL